MLKAVIKTTMTLVVCTVAAVIGFIGIYWLARLIIMDPAEKIGFYLDVAANGVPTALGKLFVSDAKEVWAD